MGAVTTMQPKHAKKPQTVRLDKSVWVLLEARFVNLVPLPARPSPIVLEQESHVKMAVAVAPLVQVMPAAKIFSKPLTAVQKQDSVSLVPKMTNAKRKMTRLFAAIIVASKWSVSSIITAPMTSLPVTKPAINVKKVPFVKKIKTVLIPRES